MIQEIIIFLVGAVAGFVAGALVYRRNVQKGEALITELKRKIEQIEKR